MAYKIGTNTVINDSRQLQNIASLDATTTSTISSAIGIASYSLGAQYAASANAITVPSGKTKMAAFAVAGGGGGATSRGGGSGGLGGTSFTINTPVTGGTTTFNVTVGGGGARGNAGPTGGTSQVYISNGDTKYLASATGGAGSRGISYGDAYAGAGGGSGTGRTGFAGNMQDPPQAGTTFIGNGGGTANAAMQGFIPITAAQTGYQVYLEKAHSRPAGNGSGGVAWSTSSNFRPGGRGIAAGPISDNNSYSQSTGGVGGTVWTFFA